ncbi:toprim domain-containing protein [Methanolapillus ohkumae]|uniref:Toprim domain-containing protein n=1 Tax=Methanolapillus ohkumae TaxID=3028298 RepID=A0AA96ZXI1_9EURY|nr:hypothetical protein MsAm2_15320 [Methanosarcinaceae archaeon Am2]
MSLDSESIRKKESLLALEDLLIRLKSEEVSSRSVIVVEGRRDILSLQKLGVGGLIFPCAFQPTAKFCEQIAELKKEVIILTDWDRRGGILASRLFEQFKNLDVTCNLEIREKILFYTKKEIKDVESLYSYVSKYRREFHFHSEEDDF